MILGNGEKRLHQKGASRRLLSWVATHSQAMVIRRPWLLGIAEWPRVTSL
jgi:hypothetical protein